VNSLSTLPVLVLAEFFVVFGESPLGFGVKINPWLNWATVFPSKPDSEIGRLQGNKRSYFVFDDILVLLILFEPIFGAIFGDLVPTVAAIDMK